MTMHARPGKEPPGFTAEQLLREPIPPVKWAIANLLPEGFSILAGPPKAGKSWLLLHAALCITGGENVLAEFSTESGPVMYLALEDTKRRLQRRIARLVQSGHNANLADLHLWPVDSWPKVSQGGIDQLHRVIHRIKPRLVIVDTCAKLRDHANGGHAYAEDYTFAAAFKQIADQTGSAVVGVFHTSKTPRSDPVDEVSGTLGLAGAADSILVLRRERQQGEGRLFVTGRDLDETEFAFSMNVEEGRWEYHGEAREHKTTEERAAVLSILDRHEGGMKPHELATLLDKQGPAVRKLLSRMAEAGEVEIRKGRYVSRDARSIEAD